MKELFDLFENDIHSEHFTRKEIIIYGVIVPVGVFIIPYVAEAIMRSWFLD